MPFLAVTILVVLVVECSHENNDCRMAEETVVAVAGESSLSRAPLSLSASLLSSLSPRSRGRTLESLDVSSSVVATLLSETRTHSYGRLTSRPTTSSSSNASSLSSSSSLLSELKLKYVTTPDKGGPAPCRGITPTTGNNDVAVAAAGKAHTERSSLQLASLSPQLAVVVAAVGLTAALTAATKTPALSLS